MRFESETRRRVVVLALLAVACGRDPIKVTGGEDSSDFGQRDLEAAVSEFVKDRSSAPGYLKLVKTVDTLKPTFNATVRDLAERYTMFLAEGVLTAAQEKPLEERSGVLALTVWPGVLNVEPKAGEAPGAFIERVCTESLPALCRRIVPEHRAVVINEEVWERVQGRARDVLRECIKCRDDATYHRTLSRLVAGHAKAREELAAVLAETSARAWPQPGPRAATWISVPTLVVRDGGGRFGDQEVARDRWQEVLVAARLGQEVLGVHLRPNDKIETLAAVIKAAKAAGYARLQLQVREQKVPYDLKAYMITLNGGGKALSVRPDETVQTLIDGLDRVDSTETPRLQVIAGQSVRIKSDL